MATIYICKCGRRVSKSTNADTTGNRDTENCKGCPYLLPWGPFEFVKSQGFVRNVKGYECRMSKDIEYATRFCGSIDDKCSCYIASLDFDFLTRVSNWIKETYPGGELNGSFFTDDIRAVEYVSNGRYRMSIGCAQNKNGIAAKAALLHQFFDASGARLDMTPEEEKAHILAAIEAGKAKVKTQERKKTMDYIISKHEATGRLYAYYKGSFWFWDSHIQRWLLSQFAEDLYQEERPKRRNFEREHFLAQTSDFHQLDDYEVPSRCIEALLQCNPKAAKKENLIDSPCASSEAGEDTNVPTSSAAATAAAEETVAAPEPSDLASMMAVSAAKTNAEVVDATNKVAASSNLPDVCRDCQCATCGNEGCASPCWENPREVGDCEITGPAGDACRDYRPKEDVQCQKENAPSADAAATSDGSAARMCEGPDEETRTTPAAASGAALESLHAQSALPQNAPAQDIAADAPSALGFDFGADVATNAELLQCAQTFVMGRVAQVMAAKKAHDITANHYQGSWGKWCQAVGISRDTGDNYVRVAENFGNIELNGKPIIEVTPISLLALGAKPSTPDVLTEGIGRGEITTIKQFRELEAQLKAVQTERDEARKAKEKAEQERDAARDAQAASSRLTNMITNQRDEAQIRAERAELRAKAAEEDAAGWKQAGLEMQEIVDQRDERIRELESGITVEAAAVDQEEIERRANELSEPLVKIIDQQNAQIERMASGNTVAAQASVLEQYLRTMQTSLLSNAQRAELAFYDVGALDSLARALRAFADEIDGLFEEGEENEDQQD